MPHRSRDSIVWFSSRTALAAGCVLSLLILLAVGWATWAERQELTDFALQRSELVARTMEAQTTRTLDTTAVALRALADVAAGRGAPDDLARLAPTLSQALVGLPFLRSLAVVDEKGRVLAATALVDVDTRVDLHALGVSTIAGRERLGQLLPGRTLADISLDNAPGAAGSQRVSFIPLTHTLELRNDQFAYIVALINPDALANFNQSALLVPESTARLATFGRVELAVSGAAAAPAASLASHPVFATQLATREHGSYIETGLTAPRQVVAFRASRTWPVVAIVEEPLSVIEQQWLVAIRWQVGVGCVAMAFVMAMSWAAHRNMRARENTRRQLDEAQLQVAHNERELSILVKSVQELIFRTDAAGRLTFVNARWAALQGQSSQEALGRHLFDVVEPSCRAAVMALFAHGDHAGMRTAQAHVRGTHGERRMLDLAVTPLRAGQQLVGFAGSAVDVTERWAAQEQLQSQFALTGLLLEISPLPISLIDGDARLVTVNHAWEEFTGMTRLKAIGRTLAELMAEEDAHDYRRHDDRLIAHGGRDRYEARLRHGDGSLRDVVVTKVLVPGDSTRGVGVLCALMDVSEFREAERATREARDAAEEASRSKSEFIANISHELRTPLQSIIGFSELGMVRGRAHEKLAAMFQDIHASGQHMLALVNDLLDVSRIESTVGTFHLERTDLRGLLRAVSRELEPLLMRRQLRLQTELPPVPMLAKVDPLRFQQVIRNVLANAIKFSPVGGEIELTGEVRASGEFLVKVRDHGPGVPEAELEAIFEAFVQSSATKDGSGGTGLGLAICRKIVEGHGGHIHAENAAGGGTCVHVALPARGATETQPAAL